MNRRSLLGSLAASLGAFFGFRPKAKASDLVSVGVPITADELREAVGLSPGEPNPEISMVGGVTYLVLQSPKRVRVFDALGRQLIYVHRMEIETGKITRSNVSPEGRFATGKHMLIHEIVPAPLRVVEWDENGWQIERGTETHPPMSAEWLAEAHGEETAKRRVPDGRVWRWCEERKACIEIQLSELKVGDKITYLHIDGEVMSMCCAGTVDEIIPPSEKNDWRIQFHLGRDTGGGRDASRGKLEYIGESGVIG